MYMLPDAIKSSEVVKKKFDYISERLLVIFSNANSEVISELKSIRKPSERISGGPK
jgi:hypothetical protein